VRPFVVLGDLMVDVVVRMTGPIAPGSDTPAQVRVRPGGAGANVSAWLAVAGVPATLVARAGDDDAGRSAIERLRGHGVTARVALDSGLPTGTCVVLVAPDGERSMLPDAGANAVLGPADLPLDAFGPGAHLHVAGYTLLREGPPREAALEAPRRARASAMTVSVDPSSAAPLARFGARRFLDFADHADLLLPNRDEAAVLGGTADAAAAARALAAGFLSAWLEGAAPGAAFAAGHALAERALAHRSAV
jgi:ribokinase